MEQLSLSNSIAQVWEPTSAVDITHLSSGLINGTWLVKNLATNQQVLLQKINTSVFPNPNVLIANQLKIWKTWNDTPAHARNFTLAKPLLFKDGTYLHRDENGDYWRLQEYFPATKTYLTGQNNSLLYKTAYSIGLFDQFLWKIEPSSITPPILQFHDLAFRFEQFTNALQQGNQDRINKSIDSIHFLKKRENYVRQYLSLTSAAKDYPTRLLHHDAKIANLLFEEKEDRVFAIIDLDTTMPGYFFSDLGDMIRSMAATANENETQEAAVQINPTFYHAIVTGYLAAVEKDLTVAELKWIHLSGVWMIYMQGLRFLTDYLLEDRYYRIEYPTQNYDRALNQQWLLQSLEELLKSKYDTAPLLA